MGTAEACADELSVKEENLISISKVADGIVEANDVIVALSQSSPNSPIGPVTPDSNNDHECSSPLTLVLSPLLGASSSCFNSTQSNRPDGINSSETPKEALFDSFAPGPDHLMALAPPHHRKYREESRIHVVRRLDFMCETNYNYLLRDIITTTSHESISGEEEEQHLFEIVYGTILDAIVSDHQTKEEVGVESGFDGFGTPTNLCGIAETCPGPPIKSSTTKYRNIDKEICKKLEFF